MKNNKKPQTVFFPGTKADLKSGDYLMPGFSSNYGKRKNAVPTTRKKQKDKS